VRKREFNDRMKNLFKSDPLIEQYILQFFMALLKNEPKSTCAILKAMAFKMGGSMKRPIILFLLPFGVTAKKIFQPINFSRFIKIERWKRCLQVERVCIDIKIL
jgi:hypothetical protein